MLERRISSGLLMALFTALSPMSARGADRFDLPFVDGSTTPIVEIQIGGGRPLRFLVDTGATGQGRIDAMLAKELGLEMVGAARVRGPGGVESTIDLVRVPQLRIGELTITNVDLAVRDLAALPFPVPISGVLGLELFAEGLLTLDYPARRVAFAPGRLEPADGRERLATLPGPVPAIELDLGAERFAAHLDSGNSVPGLSLPPELAARLDYLAPPAPSGRRAQAGGQALEIYHGTARDPLRVGAIEIPTPLVTYPTPRPIANLGSDLMSTLRLTFDPRSSVVRIERPGEAAAIR